MSLTIQRNPDQGIVIEAPNGDRLRVTLTRKNGQNKLRIEGPIDYRVWRTEHVEHGEEVKAK